MDVFSLTSFYPVLYIFILSVFIRFCLNFGQW